MRTFARRSVIAPWSFHLMPESSTEINTLGRPVVTFQAVLTGWPAAHAPRLATTAQISAIASFLPVLDEPLPMLPTARARSLARVYRQMTQFRRRRCTLRLVGGFFARASIVCAVLVALLVAVAPA